MGACHAPDACPPAEDRRGGAGERALQCVHADIDCRLPTNCYRVPCLPVGVAGEIVPVPAEAQLMARAQSGAMGLPVPQPFSKAQAAAAAAAYGRPSPRCATPAAAAAAAAAALAAAQKGARCRKEPQLPASTPCRLQCCNAASYTGCLPLTSSVPSPPLLIVCLQQEKAAARATVGAWFHEPAPA